MDTLWCSTAGNPKIKKTWVHQNKELHSIVLQADVPFFPPVCVTCGGSEGGGRATVLLQLRPCAQTLWPFGIVERFAGN